MISANDPPDVLQYATICGSEPHPPKITVEEPDPVHPMPLSSTHKGKEIDDQQLARPGILMLANVHWKSDGTEEQYENEQAEVIHPGNEEIAQGSEGPHVVYENGQLA